MATGERDFVRGCFYGNGDSDILALDQPSLNGQGRKPGACCRKRKGVGEGELGESTEASCLHTSKVLGRKSSNFLNNHFVLFCIYACLCVSVCRCPLSPVEGVGSSGFRLRLKSL